MLCKKCGAQIDDNAKVCAFCGEKFFDEAEIVADDYDQETPQAETTEEPRSTHEIFEENEKKRREQKEPVVVVVDEKEQQLSEINERRELKKKKERRKKVILVVVLCLIVAALAAGGAIYLKNGSVEDEVVTTTSTPKPIPTPNADPTSSPEPDETEEPEDTTGEDETVQQPDSQANVVTGPVKATPTPVATATPVVTKAPATTVPAAATPTPTKTPVQTVTVASRQGTNAKTYQTPQKQSGAQTKAIVSELVVGGEVIDDGTTKNPIMTFVMDGTTYYAYVSKGSWTEAINGKYMTITATATGEKYKGNTIYDISRLVYYTADDYIIPDSGVKLLAESELQKYSKEQLALARNEIFARHGRKFDTKEFADYFIAKSWYKVSDKYNYTDESSNINAIEEKNVDIILKVELSK